MYMRKYIQYTILIAKNIFCSNLYAQTKLQIQKGTHTLYPPHKHRGESQTWPLVTIYQLHTLSESVNNGSPAPTQE